MLEQMKEAFIDAVNDRTEPICWILSPAGAEQLQTDALEWSANPDDSGPWLLEVVTIPRAIDDRQVEPWLLVAELKAISAHRA